MNFIIGGTKGLGWEIAKHFHNANEETFVIGRSFDVAKHKTGMKIDLSNKDDVKKLVGYVNNRDFEIKRFFWAAGYGYLGNFADQIEAGRMAEVNFSNVVPVVQSAWKRMLGTNNETNLVIISSTTGVKPRKDEAIYAATKHAQVGLTRSLGLESERLKSKIKVALFLPGGMQTDFWEGNEPSNFSDFLAPEKVAKRICEKILEQTDYFYEETIERGSL